MSFSREYFDIRREGQDFDERCSDCSKKWRQHGTQLFIFLVAIFALNAFAIFRPSSASNPWTSRTTEVRGTTNAELEYDTVGEIRQMSPFAHTDRFIQDAAWASDAVKPWQFAVALEDSFSKQLGASHSQRWPWDDTKGVYIIQSGHELHCLHSLRDAINDLHDGLKIRPSYSHLLHCIDLLRRSTMCHADDYLLYVGKLHDNAQNLGDEAPAGEGSKRMCRDWDKLRSWAHEYSACFDGSKVSSDNTTSVLDRYKYCPDGSQPWTVA